MDPHKQTHTAAAVAGATAELLGEVTVRSREEGRERLLDWACSLDSERTWAIEDCRHVSGGLERFLLRSAERVVRVAPKLMAGARRSERGPGKSDPIDATAVARAALREPDLSTARLSGPEREIALLLDHREDLVAERTRIQQRLRWHLTPARVHAPAREYLARRQAEGKTWKEALGALKRQLVRAVLRALKASPARRGNPSKVELRTAPLVPCLT